MKRGSTTAELSICKSLALARLKAGEWGREIQSVKGFSPCLTLRLSTDPEESPSKTTQVLYNFIPLLYCRMYLPKHSWGQFSLKSCVRCCTMFIYILFCFWFWPHHLTLLSSYTAAAILYLAQWDAHIWLWLLLVQPFSPCWLSFTL